MTRGEIRQLLLTLEWYERGMSPAPWRADMPDVSGPGEPHRIALVGPAGEVSGFDKGCDAIGCAELRNRLPDVLAALRLLLDALEA